jgi:hypothetical protein
VTVTQEDFAKEGTLPAFVLRVKDDAGNVIERKYKLNALIFVRGSRRQEKCPPGLQRSVDAKLRRVPMLLSRFCS